MTFILRGGIGGRHIAGGVRVLLLTLILGHMPPVAPGAAAAPSGSTRIEQSHPLFSWGGSWTSATSASLSGGSHVISNEAGSTMTFGFFGERFDLIGMVGPKFGTATVSVDGGAPAEVDFYAPETAFGRTVYSSAILPGALHVVVVTVTGVVEPPSADAYVSIDAVTLAGTPAALPVQQSDTWIVKRGGWTSAVSPALSGGTQMLANTAGSEVAIAFTGTKLELVGATGPKFGIASVSVDGGAPVDVDLYSPHTSLRQRIFSTGELPPGDHVVKVTCTGRKNAAAADTYVALDAVLPSGVMRQALLRYEETEPLLGWGGDLRAHENPALSGGRYVRAGPGWAAVAVSFFGSRLDWIGALGPSYGIASVQVDGGAPGHVDLYAATTQPNRPVFSTGQLAHGQHTVVISWTGRANPASGASHIPIDAFDIGGEPEQAAPPARPAEPASFGYPWQRYIVVDKSDFRLYFVENGLVVKSYPVAHARVGAVTPNAIWRIDAKYHSDPLGVYGPRKMRLFRQLGSSFVYTAFLIHGTNNPASIGTRASAGCIRMHNHDVLELFPMVPLWTMVVTRE